MHRYAFAFLLATLLTVGSFLGPPAHADEIDDEPDPGPTRSRRGPSPPPVAAPAPASPAVSAADPGWKFSVAPYLWIPAKLEGTSTIDGFASDIDATFGDVIDSFDVFALMGRAEAHRDRLGLFLDVMWLSIDGDFGNSGVVRVRPDIDQIKADKAKADVPSWPARSPLLPLP